MLSITISFLWSSKSRPDAITGNLSSRDASIARPQPGEHVCRAPLNNVEAVAMFAPTVIIAQMIDVSNRQCTDV
jgi:hypothetical protein